MQAEHSGWPPQNQRRSESRNIERCGDLGAQQKFHFGGDWEPTVSIGRFERR
jgi:hypothetical protein